MKTIKKTRSFFTYFFILFIFTILCFFIYFINLNFGKSNSVDKTVDSPILQGCGIKSVPGTVTIQTKELSLELKDKDDWEWKSYQSKDFSVQYPPTREIYSMNEGFNMCPENHCQDAEMFIEKIGTKSDGSLDCGGIGYYINHPMDGAIAVWQDFRLGPYKGVAVTAFPDAEKPFDQVPGPSLEAIISANDKWYLIGLNPRDGANVSVLESFVAK